MIAADLHLSWYDLHDTRLIYAGFTDQITYVTLLVALANYLLLSKVYQYLNDIYTMLPQNYECLQ